jgi:hypothetical protein
VELALQREIRKRNCLAFHELKAAESLRSAEMVILERLESKYRPVATRSTDETVDAITAARGSSPIVPATAPVQGSLF